MDLAAEMAGAVAKVVTVAATVVAAVTWAAAEASVDLAAEMAGAVAKVVTVAATVVAAVTAEESVELGRQGATWQAPPHTRFPHLTMSRIPSNFSQAVLECPR